MQKIAFSSLPVYLQNLNWWKWGLFVSPIVHSNKKLYQFIFKNFLVESKLVWWYDSDGFRWVWFFKSIFISISRFILLSLILFTWCLMLVSECDVVLLIPPLTMKARASPRKLLSAEEWSFRIWRGAGRKLHRRQSFSQKHWILSYQLAKKVGKSESMIALIQNFKVLC